MLIVDLCVIKILLRNKKAWFLRTLDFPMKSILLIEEISNNHNGSCHVIVSYWLTTPFNADEKASHSSRKNNKQILQGPPVHLMKYVHPLQA